MRCPWCRDQEGSRVRDDVNRELLTVERQLATLHVKWTKGDLEPGDIMKIREQVRHAIGRLR